MRKPIFIVVIAAAIIFILFWRTLLAEPKSYQPLGISGYKADIPDEMEIPSFLSRPK